MKASIRGWKRELMRLHRRIGDLLPRSEVRERSLAARGHDLDSGRHKRSIAASGQELVQPQVGSPPWAAKHAYVGLRSRLNVLGAIKSPQNGHVGLVPSGCINSPANVDGRNRCAPCKGDDLVVLIDAHPRNAWLMGAVNKRLREEFAKLHVEINE